jgi:chromosome segregation ATPase
MDHRSKRKGAIKETLGEKQVEVRAQDAETNQFAAMIDGFVEQVHLVNDQYDRLNKRYADLEAKCDDLERRLDATEAEKDAILRHLSKVERLVPVPPGPPTRPWSVQKP